MASTKLNVQPLPRYAFAGIVVANGIRLRDAEITALSQRCEVRGPDTFMAVGGGDKIAVTMSKTDSAGTGVRTFTSATALLDELQRIYEERLLHKRTRAALLRESKPQSKLARYSFFGCDLRINGKVVSPHGELPRFINGTSPINSLEMIRTAVNPGFLIQRRHQRAISSADYNTPHAIIAAINEIRAERAAWKLGSPLTGMKSGGHGRLQTSAYPMKNKTHKRDALGSKTDNGKSIVSSVYLSKKPATRKAALALRVGDLLRCYYADTDTPLIALVVCRSTKDDPTNFSVVMQESWGNEVRQRRLPQWGLNTDRWEFIGSTSFPSVTD